MCRKIQGPLKGGIWFLFFVFLFSPALNYAQSGLCTPNVPFYTVNLTGNPNGSWVSAPPIVRAGSCCGSTWPDRCIEFQVTLDPQAVAINFQIASGAVPSGSMYYQLGCGPLTPVGQPICINGPGPHTITFCKPGSNLNTYQITSISGPKPTPDDTTSDGCSAKIYTNGLIPSTITWTDITGGGAYNSYLSCTVGCDTVSVTPQTGYPPYVDYKVCGKPAAGPCYPVSSWCDTVRVYFVPPLNNQINPNPASFCANNPGVWLTGVINGGDGKYIYIWRDGSGNYLDDSLSYRAVTPGTYTLEVRDGTYPSCPAKFTTVVVKADPVPTVNAGSDIIVCADNPIVNLSGNITGATGGKWTGGSGTFSPSDSSLTPTYTPTSTEINNGIVTLTLTTTGNGACNQVTDQITIRFAPQLTANVKATPVCSGAQNSVITATASGGTQPYTFRWNTGQTGPVITQPPGTYIVTVTDAAQPVACSAVVTVTVPQYPPLYVNIDSSATVVSCGNSINVSSTVSGGSAPYTYLWNNGQTTPGITVIPGTYVVTVTDAARCTSKDTVKVIGANTTLGITINNPTPLCYGIKAQLTATGTGGFGGYSYLWNNGSSANSILVGPGNYCVEVTDSAGCKVSSCASVEQDSALVVTTSGPSIICYGGSTSIGVTASGGRWPYSYQWNNGQNTSTIAVPVGTYTVTVTDGNPNKCSATATFTVKQAPPVNVSTTKTNTSCYGSNNGSATAYGTGGIAPYTYLWTPGNYSGSAVYNLPPGSYTVTVTDSLGCQRSDTLTISQPAPVSAAINSTTNVNCSGGSNGTIIASASGGTPGYNYQWSNNTGNTNTATGLKAGTYTVIVTDSKGCRDTVTTVITEPLPLILSSDSTPASCFAYNNGTATVTPSGGVPAYTYQWSNGGSTGPTLSGLLAGSYTVTVRDAKGCSKTDVIIIPQPALLSVSVTNNGVTCFGGNDGSATAQPAGGNMPYFYSWSAPISSTGSSVSGLQAGTYTVTLTDVRGCVATSSVTIPSSPLLTVSASPTSYVSCDGTGTISATASGGSGIFTYSWSNGATGPGGISVPTGSYTVTVFDNKGCSATDTVSVIALNSTLTGTISGPSNICPGATTTLSVSVSGAFGSYTVLWNTGATSNSIAAGPGSYCAKITDSGGCIYNACKTVSADTISIKIPVDSICAGSTTLLIPSVSGSITPYTYFWSTGATTSSVTVGAGTYTLTVRDAANCPQTHVVKVNQPPTIAITVTDTVPVSCFKGKDGSAAIEVSGGFSPYVYWWSPRGDTSSSVFGLSSGTYTVTVSDRKGCTASTLVVIKEPANPLLIDSALVTQVLCYGGNSGSITVMPVGGVLPYNFLWWNTNNTSPTRSGLTAGTYGVTIGDANGCVTDTVIQITEPPLLRTFLIEKKNITCNGMGNGSVTLTPTGGTPAYTYSWSPSGGNDSIATGLSPGVFTVTVTDKNGCSLILTETLSQPPLLAGAVTNPVHVTCNGGADGRASVTPSGGTAPYTYLWSPNGSTANYASALKAGKHFITVTDANGCTVKDSVTITEPPPIVLSTGTNDSICIGDSAIIWVSATGGSGVYTFTWSHLLGNGTTYTVSPIEPTTYSVSIIDSKGCISAPGAVTIYVHPPLSVVISGSDTICAGKSVSISAKATGGNGNYNYIWNNSLGTGPGPFTVTPSRDTSFVVTVTDNCGTPVATDTFFIKVYPLPKAVIYASDTAGCEWLPIQFSADSVGNPPGTTYFWNFGDGTTSTLPAPYHVYSYTGTYNVTLTVTSPAGCKAFDSIPGGVSVYPSPVADFDYMPYDISIYEPVVTFRDKSIDAVTWQWRFGDNSGSSLQHPVHIYEIPGYHTITLIVTNTYGCTDTAEKTLYIRPEVSLYVPNAFTPNNDGENDYFKAYGIGFKDFKMYIYDRWGDLIFVSNNIDIGWDGHANGGRNRAQADVYVYLIIAVDILDETHKRVGSVTLIR